MRYADCHPDRKHFARGLCGPCYKERQHAKTARPARCHPERLEEARGLCAACYRRRQRQNDEGPRATCHPERRHAGLGLCDACYQTQWRRSHPEANTAQTWMRNHPERYQYLKRRATLKKHGIDPDGYAALWAAQDGRCANRECRAAFPAFVTDYRIALQVDHDHPSGNVRGLLCGPCNATLGRAHDSIPRLRGLIAYLESHPIRPPIGKQAGGARNK